MYHCLRGKHLYEGAGPEAAIAVAMIERPEELKISRAKNARDEALFKFVNRCIDTVPDRRPRSASECRDTLAAILDLGE